MRWKPVAAATIGPRLLQAQGHQVELMPPQHVKAYLRGQKNDYNDAQAIAEACLHDQIRPVPIKSVAQQDEQMLHRMREQIVRDRTALANQIRGLLNERGFVLRRGIEALRQQVPEILETESPELTVMGRQLLSRQYQRLLELDGEVKWYEQQLRVQVKQDDVCRRLAELPGFGVVVSSAFKSWIGQGDQFKRGRDVSAALGLVPRQHTTGGNPAWDASRNGATSLCAARSSTEPGPSCVAVMVKPIRLANGSID